MIIPLRNIDSHPVGGKARGLGMLISAGMEVPGTMVLVNPVDNSWETELDRALSDLGDGPKAVRSSATAEDGDQASFAGQFETILNVDDRQGIILAVRRCMDSLRSARANVYRSQMVGDEKLGMSVLIQNMVDASLAGVVFTANPVNHRRDQAVISVTSGLGDKLVAGEVEGEQVILTKRGKILQSSQTLGDDMALRILNEAIRAERYFGHPLDLEWAIDKEGRLFWLQARPVTTLDDVHLNELDHEVRSDDEILTRGNIGEMMPGPVTPLTYSVFGRAIEYGMQDFYIRCGAQKEFTPDWLYFKMFYNHLFINISGLYAMTTYVLLNRKGNVEFSIMGETLADERKIPKAAFWKRLVNQFRQFRYIRSTPARLKKLQLIDRNFRVALHDDICSQYEELDRALPLIFEAYSHHYCTSSQSGFMHSAIMGILTGGKVIPSREDHRTAASLMVDIPGIESADLVRAIDRMVLHFETDDALCTWIREHDRAEVLAYLSGNKPIEKFTGNDFPSIFQDFLKKNGHRCVREAELREKDWSQEPAQVVDIIKTRLEFHSTDRVPGETPERLEDNFQAVLSRLNWIRRNALRIILPKARRAVARREVTKSHCIRMQQKMKQAYLHLGDLLVKAGLLDDTDQVFFLTHQELGESIRTSDQQFRKKAGKRRELVPALWDLRFPDVSYGKPEPINAIPVRETGTQEGVIYGIPVSMGKVSGTARIIRSLDDATRLRQDDIMVCQFTDIGWTPYFSIISGLVTEIGSPLSHGAVVAREYGLPAVVNAKGAMAWLNDGEKIEIDGSKGVLRRL